jgi:hypothetical protein
MLHLDLSRNLLGQLAPGLFYKGKNQEKTQMNRSGGETQLLALWSFTEQHSIPLPA